MIEKSIFKDGANKNLTHPKMEKGITLIALIITIIVLLILAVVAIRAVQGDGIIGHTKNATDEYSEGMEKEKSILDSYTSYIDFQLAEEAYDGETKLQWDVSKNQDKSIIATMYDNEQFGGNAGEYTLVFSGSGETSAGPYVNYMGNIVKAEIGYGVTSIGACTFAGGFTNLTSVTISNSVANIGQSAFSDCRSLTNVIIPSSVKSIGQHAFGACTSLTSITIPNSVTSIENATFSGCTSLTSITIPNSVTSMGNTVFQNCTSLASITIPSSVKSIGPAIFYGCTSLTSITIPNSVTSIEDATFNGCTSLTSITIPSSVTSINSFAFSGCTNLTTINYKGTATGSPWGATNATVITQ